MTGRKERGSVPSGKQCRARSQPYWCKQPYKVVVVRTISRWQAWQVFLAENMQVARFKAYKNVLEDFLSLR